MTNPMIKLVNAHTGEEIIRDMNAEELAQMEADKATQLTAAAAKATKTIKKIAAATAGMTRAAPASTTKSPAKQRLR